MLRRILSIALVVIGLAAIGLAVASATVWRESDTVTATLPSRPEAPLLVTEPGVLEVVANDVAIRAVADDGAPVVLALGREVDVMGWVGGTAHVLVTGLSDWDVLASTAVDGEAEAPSPAGSDMWVVEVTGEGQAELEWSETPGRWSLLAATDGAGPAPTLELTWQREVTTPLLVPGLVVGGLLVLIGIVLLLVGRRRYPEPDVSAIRSRLGLPEGGGAEATAAGAAAGAGAGASLVGDGVPPAEESESPESRDEPAPIEEVYAAGAGSEADSDSVWSEWEEARAEVEAEEPVAEVEAEEPVAEETAQDVSADEDDVDTTEQKTKSKKGKQR